MEHIICNAPKAYLSWWSQTLNDITSSFFYSDLKQHEDLQWLGNFTKSIEDIDRQMVISLTLLSFLCICPNFFWWTKTNERSYNWNFFFVCFRTRQRWSYCREPNKMVLVFSTLLSLKRSLKYGTNTWRKKGPLDTIR